MIYHRLIISLKIGCTYSVLSWYKAFIESYYFLCVKKTIQEVFHAYLNKFENAVTHLFPLYWVIIDSHGSV